MKNFNGLDVLTVFTKSLLENGIDYEVTMKGSKVTVQLFEDMTNTSLGCATGNSLEESLATVVGQVIGKHKTSSDKLSYL